MSQKGETYPLVDESDRNERRDERRRRFDPRRACMICCICLLIVIVIILLIVGFKYWYSSRQKSRSTEQVLCGNSHGKKGAARNVTDFLKNIDKICNVRDTSTAGTRIYIIKGEHNLTDKQACGLESMLRLFPDKTIYLIDFNKKERVVCDRCSSPPNYLGLLLYLYKDRLELMLADKVQFFKNSPAECANSIDQHLEFMAMLVTAYKYGGFVATPDMVLTSRDYIQCFPEETIVEPFAIFAPNRCDDYLLYLIRSFVVCEGHYTADLEDLLTKSAALYANQSSNVPVRRLGPKEVCTKVKHPCPFLKLKNFQDKDSKWVYDLSGFCKQVVQAYLGITINRIEVEEETSIVKSKIMANRGKNTCDKVKELKGSVSKTPLKKLG